MLEKDEVQAVYDSWYNGEEDEDGEQVTPLSAVQSALDDFDGDPMDIFY